MAVVLFGPAIVSAVSIAIGSAELYLFYPHVPEALVGVRTCYLT